ncbi:MAG: glycosyltransferase family 39 protein [Elusimicrobia bacterium]|nr:glycosyltransferase family 39 protein [Elusimicrobiota bacterium]
MIPRSLWVLLVLALSSPFWSLSHPLVEVDDARYAEIPREMAESGDWATPRLNYLDYVEKPPLWYWLGAASYKVFGVSEASARLPLALLSLAGMLGLVWLGSWAFSPQTGIMAALVLGSSGLYFFLSHYITPDLPLTVFLLWCSAMILRCLLRPADASWAAPLAWVFAALAFLSKGLVALIFPTAWAMALLILFPELRQHGKRLISPRGAALFTGIAAPWFLYMEHRHPGFLKVFFLEQHVQRFLTEKYNRNSPFYFFFLVLPAGLLPWIGPVLAGWTRVWKSRERAPLALAIWSTLIFAFFSASKSKLATYILPVFPQLSLLAAWALEKPLPVWARRLSLALGGLFLAAALAILFIKACVPGLAGLNAALAGLLLASLGIGLLRSATTSEPALALALAGFLAGGLSLFALLRNAETLSARSLAASVAERARPEDKVYSYGVYLHGLPFYARRPVDKLVNWTGELHYAKRYPENTGRFGDDNDLRALPAPGHRTFVVFRSFEAPHVISLVGAKNIKRLDVFGSWVLAEF